MNTTFLTSINFNGQKIVPSNIFELGGNRYLLLDISRNNLSDEVYLHIIGMRGSHAAREFHFALNDLASDPESLFNS